MSKFEGIDQGVDIELSTINVIITRKSILTLYSFILDTFASSPTSTPAPTNQIELQPGAELEGNSKPQTPQTPQPPQPSKPSTIRVKVKLNSIRFILNNDGVRLATGLLSRADVAVHLRQN